MRAFCLFFLCVYVYSADCQKSISIDTVIVQAMNIPLKISETGRSISIIKSEELQSFTGYSIDEILQTVTGVEVQSRGAFGAQGDIIMRGSTFTQVLVLVDGMKVNDPLTGHFNSYLPVTLPEIERIEVLRGSASAMYGPDAVGGVINIITKTFSNTLLESKLSGELSFGENKLINAETGFYKADGKFKISGGINIKQSTGESFEAIEIDTNNILEAYNGFFDLKTVGASIAYNFNEKNSLKFRTAFDHRDFDARYYYTTSPFDKSTEIVANNYNHLQFTNTSEKSSTDINLAYKHNTDEFIFSPDFPSTNNHTSKYYNFTANHYYPVNEKMNLKGGIQVDLRSIDSNDRGNHDDMHYGAYALLHYKLNRSNLIFNLRTDYDDNYKFQILPSVNYSYRLNNLIIRSSIGKSIRAADYTERFVSNNLIDLTPGRSLGNPNLSSESSWSAELGFDFDISNNWQLSSTLFGRKSDKLVDYVSTNQNEIGSISETGSLQENENYFFAKNISNVNTVGLEFESRLGTDVGKIGRFDWTIGYTFLNTTNSEDIISVYISNAAKHLLTNKIQVRLRNFKLDLTTLYKQREERIASAISSNLNDSYTLWNMDLRYDIAQSVYFKFGVRNLFDSEYQNILGSRMPGRWMSIGMGWAL